MLKQVVSGLRRDKTKYQNKNVGSVKTWDASGRKDRAISSVHEKIKKKIKLYNFSDYCNKM